MEAFFALFVITLTLVFTWMKYQLTYWKRRGIPHDKPEFLYGNFKGWRKTKHFIDLLDPIYNKYKGSGFYVGFYMFTKPCVLATDLEFVKNVLIKDFNNFDERGLFHNEDDDVLSGNMFTLDGKKWRVLRQKFSQTFTSGKMKFMFPTVVDIGHQLVDVFGKKIKEANKQDGLEVTDLVGRFTADVIGSCAFGLECKSLYNPQADFVVFGRRALVDTRHNKLIDNLMETFPKLARKLYMRQKPDDIDRFYTNVVKDTLEYREKHQVQRRDFMNILIEMRKNNNLHLAEKNLTFEEIVAQCFIFFIGGFETSATTLGFALYELAKNSEVQEKLRNDINRVMKAHNGEFIYECLQEMKYLDQVISETLRKYPIASILIRKSQNHYETTNPKYYIEKDTTIMIPVNAIHHDPSIYPEPEKFDPDRFTYEEIKKRPACSWLPFGDGPRNCIGMRFGKMQVAVGLVFLIQHFKFSFCDATPKSFNINKESPTLAVLGGIRLRVDKL